MKVLFAAILLVSSAASASGGTQTALDRDSAQSCSESPLHHRPEPCEPQRYSCGGNRYAEVDLCSNGSYYLRGTDIPFQGCDSDD